MCFSVSTLPYNSTVGELCGNRIITCCRGRDNGAADGNPLPRSTTESRK